MSDSADSRVTLPTPTTTPSSSRPPSPESHPDDSHLHPAITPDPTDPNSPSKYTFGVELEFLLPQILPPKDTNRLSHDDTKTPRPDTPREDPDATDIRWFPSGIPSTDFPSVADRLVRFIRGRGCCSSYGHATDWRALMRKIRRETRESGFRMVEGFTEMYQCWFVHEDSSLTHLARAGWKGYDGVRGVEISSPVLRPMVEGYRQLCRVIFGLRLYFRILTDPSCGLHVHIGTGLRPMHMDHLKRFIALVWVADPLLSSTTHHSRRWRDGHAVPLRQASHLATMTDNELLPFQPTPELDRYLPRSWDVPVRLRMELNRIWECKTHQDLLTCLHTRGKMKTAVSLFPLRAHGANHVKGSIELRYREGSVDPVLVTQWVRILMAMFRVADNGAEGQGSVYAALVKLLATQEPTSSETLREFLTMLDLKEEFEYWRDIIARQSQLEPQNEAVQTYLKTYVLPLLEARDDWDPLYLEPTMFNDELMRRHHLQHSRIFFWVMATDLVMVRDIFTRIELRERSLIPSASGPKKARSGFSRSILPFRQREKA